MTEEKFKKYLDEIKGTKKFKEIESIIKFNNYSTPDSLFGKITRYLSFFHSRGDSPIVLEAGSGNHFIPDYDYFKRFYESYKSGDFKPSYNEDGSIDLKNTLYLEQPPMFSSGNGWFTDSYLLFPNGDIAISKYPLNYKSGKSGVGDSDCSYCPIVATGIAKAIGVSTSENVFGRRKDGQLRIFSKNFLAPNEELITFIPDGKTQKSSDILSELDQTLMLRKFDSVQIEDAKFEFLKQDFMAKLIGLKDQKASNTGLITSVDRSGKHVRMAPMFDYDYSFFIGEKSSLPVLTCDNGETDIASFIKQYKDYPGFLDFAKGAVSSLDMNNVYENIYKDTGIKAFKSPEENQTLNRFTSFVNENLGKAKQVLHELEPNERGEK